MPNAVLVGERHARRLPGFDAGNSPTEILSIGVAGRPVVHTTHAGTQGLVNATGADEVLTANLKRALALVDVQVLDHFVVGADATVSFRERGMI
jgi:2-phosphosulfolactate phosphatase